MKKLSLMIILAALSLCTFAQSTKTVKGKKPVAETATDVPKIHSLYISDAALNELLGSANAGFNSWIMTTPIPANSIANERKYFGAVLQNILLQQKTWQKVEADSLVKNQQDRAKGNADLKKMKQLKASADSSKTKSPK